MPPYVVIHQSTPLNASRIASKLRVRQLLSQFHVQAALDPRFSYVIRLHGADLNIPLGFSRRRVNIFPDFVISVIPQHGPDHTYQVSA